MTGQQNIPVISEFPLDHAPRRIVSLVPSMTESLFDMNLGGRLVGITDYCVHPAKNVSSLPRVGGTKTPDIAAIIDLKPDLVLGNREENRKEDIEALAASGIPVWVMYPRTVADVFVILWEIMERFGETSMVPRIRLIEQMFDLVRGTSEAMGKRPRVFVPIWKQPLMTINHDTYLHDVIAVCGGENVFALETARYPKISLEAVEAAQPDIVLLPSEPYAFMESDKAMFSKMDIPAAKYDHIRLLDGSLLTWHGTRLAYTLDVVPGLLFTGELDD